MAIVSCQMGENAIVQLVQCGPNDARKCVKILGIQPATLISQFGNAIAGDGLEDGDDGVEIRFADGNDSERPVDYLKVFIIFILELIHITKRMRFTHTSLNGITTLSAITTGIHPEAITSNKLSCTNRIPLATKQNTPVRSTFGYSICN